MKALTIRQPWAELILRGRKPFELRSWRTHYRGTLVIHAAAKIDAEDARHFGLNPSKLITGAFVGVAILSDMVYRPWSLEGKRIETMVLRDPVPPMSVGLAWRKNREFSPGMHAVREYFRHTFMEPRSVVSNL